MSGQTGGFKQVSHFNERVRFYWVGGFKVGGPLKTQKAQSF